MKRSIKYLIVLLILLLTGCSNKTYTVNFDTNGGEIMESITVNKGDNIKDIKVPVKEGYLFVNWLKDGIEYKNDSPITKDITLTANWVEAPDIYNYYQVTFVIGDTVEKISVKENEKVTPPKEKEINNHIFLGWFSGEEKFDLETPITKDISLTAKYELNLVTITYNLQGGIGLAIETIPKNTTLTIPEVPYKPNHKFLKWMLGNEEFSFDTPITKDITLTAIWEEIIYVTVNFDTNGGTTIEDKKIEKHNKIGNVETPEKEGYTFVEWQLNGEKFDFDTLVEENITLKAIYKEKETEQTE